MPAVCIVALYLKTNSCFRGVLSMARTRRIMISLPQNLLKEVDGVVEMEKRTRKEFIREAMKLYLGT